MKAKAWPKRRLMFSLLGPVMVGVGERYGRYVLVVDGWRDR